MLSRLLSFLGSVVANQALIRKLISNDIRNRYLGSFLGFAWAFLNPLAIILTLTFVFTFGFRTAPISEVPFVVWLTTGLLPWFFISDTISAGSTAILDNAHLVKKIIFRHSLLGVVKFGSAFLLHLLFMAIFIVYALISGVELKISILQLPVIWFFTGLFLLGLNWLTSSLTVFFRDLTQVIAIVLQLGFWLTPIFWLVDNISPQYHFWLKLNPFYFVINAYRECLLFGGTVIYSTWFVYYIIISVSFFIVGALTYQKLKFHFADVI